MRHLGPISKGANKTLAQTCQHSSVSLTVMGWGRLKMGGGGGGGE